MVALNCSEGGATLMMGASIVAGAASVAGAAGALPGKTGDADAKQRLLLATGITSDRRIQAELLLDASDTPTTKKTAAVL